ncbi:M18 family aminopeptidase [Marinospirillum perlucidum]|uniref:M18 family aminopeptidase n=1 Tax=Marinospirillum perlucidum TaxID=1982602 RepID=UPI000DF3D176|nr:M18 family aminopeptidase [Marinospirillum perlucidum]
MQSAANFNQGLMQFLQQATAPAQAVAAMSERLNEAGFSLLQEDTTWELQPGQGYYVIRGGKSLIAWRQGQAPVAEAGVRMLGAHTDSPCLKVKPNAEIIRHGCLQLGVEVYGGALLNPWFDRDLSLAGQVHYWDNAGQLHEALLDLREPLGIIPSLAIHLNREANKGMEINPQKYLPVVLCQAEEEDPKLVFRELLASWLKEAGHAEVSEVVDYELCFYDTQPPALVGLHQEYLASARLDNLLSCYVGLEALLAGDPGTAATRLLVCNDHEEVGSASSIGAEGPFLESLLRRLSGDEPAYQRTLSLSLMVSCDNAHALHPNFPERHDENHGPRINAGPVIKINANQRYATSSETSALFAGYCRRAQVPFQRFVVRTDMGCGSTLGPITATRLGVRVVDVGVPQWGMHSVRETVGSQDAWYLTRALQVFLDSESLAVS